MPDHKSRARTINNGIVKLWKITWRRLRERERIDAMQLKSFLCFHVSRDGVGGREWNLFRK